MHRAVECGPAHIAARGYFDIFSLDMLSLDILSLDIAEVKRGERRCRHSRDRTTPNREATFCPTTTTSRLPLVTPV